MEVTGQITIPDEEIELVGIRSQGAGGQNVNKVSSAIHLRFDISASSLPDELKVRLLSLKDRRINSDGVVVIKAQRYRSQDKNREDALERLRQLVIGVTQRQKRRVPTKPTRGSRERRLQNKMKRGSIKALRKKVIE